MQRNWYSEKIYGSLDHWPELRNHIQYSRSMRNRFETYKIESYNQVYTHCKISGSKPKNRILNNDCLMGIFIHCDIETICNIYEVSKQFREVILYKNFIHAICEKYRYDNVDTYRLLQQTYSQYHPLRMINEYHGLESYTYYLMMKGDYLGLYNLWAYNNIDILGMIYWFCKDSKQYELAKNLRSLHNFTHELFLYQSSLPKYLKEETRKTLLPDKKYTSNPTKKAENKGRRCKVMKSKYTITLKKPKR